MNELSPELTFLLWAVALTFIQLIISLLGAAQQHGQQRWREIEKTLAHLLDGLDSSKSSSKYAGKPRPLCNTRNSCAYCWYF